MEITIKICLDDKQIKQNRMFDNIKKHIQKKHPFEEKYLSNNNTENEWSNERWEDTSSEGKGFM